MSAGKQFARAGTGATLTIIPGYQSWSAAQRDAALSLREAGQLGRRLYSIELADGAVRVTDQLATFIIKRDGGHERVALPSTGG